MVSEPIVHNDKCDIHITIRKRNGNKNTECETETEHHNE